MKTLAKTTALAAALLFSVSTLAIAQGSGGAGGGSGGSAATGGTSGSGNAGPGNTGMGVTGSGMTGNTGTGISGSASTNNAINSNMSGTGGVNNVAGTLIGVGAAGAAFPPNAPPSSVAPLGTNNTGAPITSMDPSAIGNTPTVTNTPGANNVPGGLKADGTPVNPALANPKNTTLNNTGAPVTSTSPVIIGNTPTATNTPGVNNVPGGLKADGTPANPALLGHGASTTGQRSR